MSAAPGLTKLPANIQKLVNDSALGNVTTSTATTGTDPTGVDQWIDKIASEEVLLPELETTLSTKTYLVGTSPSIADVALYGALHPLISVLTPAQYYGHPSVTRYFDHIQNLPAIRAIPDAPAVVPIDIENAPKAERKAEVKKEKKPKKEGEQAAAAGGADAAAKKSKSKGKEAAPASGAAEDTPATTDAAAPKQKEKKEKKPKEAAAAAEGGKKKGGAANAPAAAADSGEPSPANIDLRVGHIVDVKKHPDADGLYIEQIDLGEETGPRTIISGLVNYVPIEKMQDKWLVVVANLKPVSMRGIKSYGMVLCATSKDGKEGGIEIIDPPPNSKPGDRVYFEGEKYENVEPQAQLNPKKKVFETIQPNFTTLDTREAAWVDPVTKSVHKIRTQSGVCTAPTLVGASLS